MPLLDHFHPPLSKQRHWDSFHGAWTEAIARHLNEELLPARFYAEARVKMGSRVEIDVATHEEANGQPHSASGGVAVWAPPAPTAMAALDFTGIDTFEVHVLNDEEGPKIVAAIELVSPANKDRPTHRQAFAIKCASYLQDGISLLMIDVVTERRGNLHAELLTLLKLPLTTPGQDASDLYAAAYRPFHGSDRRQMALWTHVLAIGAALPTMPLWIGEDVALPLDLEATYQSACVARRIHVE